MRHWSRLFPIVPDCQLIVSWISTNYGLCTSYHESSQTHLSKIISTSLSCGRGLLVSASGSPPVDHANSATIMPGDLRETLNRSQRPEAER